MNPSPPDHSEGLCRRLLAYPAWAAGGLVGFSGFEADAAMVCMDPGIALTPGFEDPVFMQLDINGDGVNEIGLGVGTASNPDSQGNNGMVTAGGIFGNQVAFTAPFPLGVPGAFYGGDSVGSGLGFTTAIGTLALSSAGFGGGQGAWWGGNDAYFGVMFDIDIDGILITHYGWVHAVWDPSVNTLTIAQVGYEDTGGAALIPLPMEEADLDITPMPGGEMELRWQAQQGFTYFLERSDNLNGWSVIHTVTPADTGEEGFIDAGGGTLNFYRVRRNCTSLLWLALGMPARRRRK